MVVEQIMTTGVVTVRDDASPTLAVRLLAERALTMLPVVDADNRLVGVVTEADLLGLPLPADPCAHLRTAGRTVQRSRGSPSTWSGTVAVSQGEAGISGPGSGREADAAASLTATVTGVRRVRVVDRTAHAPGRAATALTSVEGLPQQWVCLPSSATGADQL